MIFTNGNASASLLQQCKIILLITALRTFTRALLQHSKNIVWIQRITAETGEIKHLETAMNGTTSNSHTIETNYRNKS